MSDHILQQLQQSAQSALKSQTVQEGIQHLSNAFHLFSEEIGRVKNSYLKLQERLDAVNQELALEKIHSNRSAQSLNPILKNISDGVLFINLQGTVTLCNEAAQNLLNLQGKEVLFKNFWDLFQDGEFGFSMREALQFGISHKLFYRKEMQIITAFIYEVPKIDQGLLLVCKDVREKQKLETLGKRKERMKELGEIAATVAHEIRNALGGIRGYAALLYRDLASIPSLQEMAESILQGTKSLERIVAAILHYSKPIEIELQTLNLGAFLKQVVKFVKVDPACPSNIKFSLHIPDAPLLAPFDPEAMKSALLNLIFNGIQAMPDGGEITLSLLQMESSCQIGIADTGLGIEEELLKNLFSPFYTTKKGGNGLGLVETQKIVQEHLGTIAVRSQPGKGTVFTLTLPLKR